MQFCDKLPYIIGFLNAFRRHSLWILGNERTLTKRESVWEALVHDAKARRCFFNADEDKGLAKAILDAKKKFDQLDDLLNGDSVLFNNTRWKVCNLLPFYFLIKLM